MEVGQETARSYREHRLIGRKTHGSPSIAIYNLDIRSLHHQAPPRTAGLTACSTRHPLASRWRKKRMQRRAGLVSRSSHWRLAASPPSRNSLDAVGTEDLEGRWE